MQVPNETITSICLSGCDGVPLLLAGPYDTQIHLWRLDTGELLPAPLEGHSSTVTALTVPAIEGSPALFSGILDGTVRRWRLGLQLEKPRCARLDNTGAVAIGRIGAREVAAIAHAGGVTVCDLKSGDTVLRAVRGG